MPSTPRPRRARCSLARGGNRASVPTALVALNRARPVSFDVKAVEPAVLATLLKVLLEDRFHAYPRADAAQLAASVTRSMDARLLVRCMANEWIDRCMDQGTGAALVPDHTAAQRARVMLRCRFQADKEARHAARRQ